MLTLPPSSWIISKKAGVAGIPRDLQGLAGPHGFTVRVVAATASGRDIAARAPPVPVLGLCGYFFFFARRTSEPKKWIVFRLTLVVNAFGHLSAIFLAFSAFCSRRLHGDFRIVPCFTFSHLPLTTFLRGEMATSDYLPITREGSGLPSGSHRVDITRCANMFPL
jgi:hypothetical protein